MKKKILTILITGIILNSSNIINVQAKEQTLDTKKGLDVLDLSEEELDKLNYKKNGDLNNLTADELEKRIVDSKGGIEKLELSKKISEELGITRFWENIDSDALENYESLKENKVPKKRFSKKELDYINSQGKLYEEFLSKIEEYNKSIDIPSKRSGYSNNITVESVKNNAVVGDVVLMDNPGAVSWGLINHAGIYDGTAGKDWRWVLSSRPGVGVDWETIETIASYDEAIFYNVYRTSYNEAYYSTQRAIKDAIGKPYPEGLSWVQSIKGSTANFYCSKVPWHGYSKITGVDIDYNKGLVVYPEDIYHSPETIRRITYR